jgi:tetratricopeptide (TPR) repeat protein
LGGVVAGVAVMLPLLYLVLPGVWDATVGPLVGIKARIHPDAIPLMEQGQARMLDDTDAGYAEGLQKLDAALAKDPLYPEAVAFAGLSHVFWGRDIQDRGRAVRAEGEALVAELKSLTSSKAAKAAPERIDELRAKAKKADQEAAKLFETGGDHLQQAGALFETARHRFSNNPTVVAAGGIYMLAMDLERASAAKDWYEAALSLRGLKALDAKAPPDPWLPFLQAMLKQSTRTPEGNADSVEFWEAAARKEPRLQRARYEQGLALERAGKKDQAIAVLRQVLAAVPNHAKAKAALERIQSDRAKALANPVTAEAKPAKRR